MMPEGNPDKATEIFAVVKAMELVHGGNKWKSRDRDEKDATSSNWCIGSK